MVSTPVTDTFLDPKSLDRMVLALDSIILVFYGVYITLTAICIHYLLFSNKKRRGHNIVLAYTFFSLITSTAYMASTAKYTETYFIEDIKKYDGLLTNLLIVEQVSYITKIWLTDCLLIYRLWVIWDRGATITLFPIGLLCGCFGTGIAVIILLYRNVALGAIINLVFALNTCSIALNILATSLIAGKLLTKRKWAKTLNLEHARLYLSMTTIFAESGALYSVIGLIYIPLVAVNSPLRFIFSPFMDAATGIAPMLIILRVALGVAISKQALTSMDGGIETHPESGKTSGVEFAPNCNCHNSVSRRSSGTTADSHGGSIIDQLESEYTINSGHSESKEGV